MTETATEPKPFTENGTRTDQPSAPTGWHQLPLVNLLPPEIVEGRRFARTRKILIGVLVGTLLAGGLATFAEQRSVRSAQTEVDQATSEVASLQQQQQKYRAVPALSAQIQAASAARSAAMGQDVLWYRLFTDMDGARPTGLSTGSITVALAATDSTSSGQSSGQADPLTKAGIGTVTFAGSAAAYDGVSTFMEALDAVAGLNSTALSEASRDQDGKVGYTVASVVTDKALSHRFTAKGH